MMSVELRQHPSAVYQNVFEGEALAGRYRE
jgi:hypothetical protein